MASPEWMVLHAVPEEAKQLAEVQSASFLATYTRSVRTPLDAERNMRVLAESRDFKTTARIEARQQLIVHAEDNPTHEMYLTALDGETPIGLLYGVNRKPEDVAEGKPPQELVALYVHPKYLGRGVGTALMKPFITWADREKPIDAGVVEFNTAQDFYRKMGFEAIGRNLHPAYSFLDEIIMRRPAGVQL